MTMSPPPEWVMATRNRGKLRELGALFVAEGIRVIDLGDAGIAERDEEEGLECHDTFEENALAKARYFRAHAGGRIVVADDSGLEVCALGNAPGVRSKRWSERRDVMGAALDAANNAMLRTQLAGVANRRARFVCAAAWCGAGREVVALGAVDGSIVDAGRGTQGFGYDPHFHVAELGMTMAEADVDAKQGVSHRGRAVRALLVRLREDGLV